MPYTQPFMGQPTYFKQDNEINDYMKQ